MARTLARALERRALRALDTSARGAQQCVGEVYSFATRRTVAFACLVALACYETALWHECAPVTALRLERHAAIARDERCNPRSPAYTEWHDCLDCTTPLTTLSKGYIYANLECMATRHPLVSYTTLLTPLVYPRFATPQEWLFSAAALLFVTLLVSWCVPGLFAYWREQQLQRVLVGEMRSMRKDLRHRERERDRNQRERERERSRSRSRSRSHSRWPHSPPLAVAPRTTLLRLAGPRIEEIE